MKINEIKDRKYDCCIFPNGRVVFYENKDFENALQAGKELAIVCLAWSGGYAYVRGAEIRPNYWVDEDNAGFGEACFECYGYDLEDVELGQEELGKFYKMIFSSGDKIYMETGDQANAYQGGMFIDWDSKFENMAFASGASCRDDFEKMRKVVDARKTVRMLEGKSRDQKLEKIKTLIAYGILPENSDYYLI